jgi:hypothetical protein
MQLQYPMPVEMSEENKQKPNDIFKSALPEKRHLNMESNQLLRRYTDLDLLQVFLLSSLILNGE